MSFIILYILTILVCKISAQVGGSNYGKANDTVPHDGLLSKLNHYGVYDKIWLWIYNFIFKKNRKQSIVVDGKQSSLIDVVSGVPQDTV